MAIPVDPSAFKEALIILSAAAIVIPLFHRLKVSPVLGFLLVGMAVGPFGLGMLVQFFPWINVGVITDRQMIAPVAEMGVVLLLFTIGLELSLERLALMARLVFGLGLAQVMLSACVIGWIAFFIGFPPPVAFVIGLALALSSTAVIIQVLQEEKKLQTSAGRQAFAVLLFQDIAVVPILLTVKVLAAKQSGSIFIAFSVAVLQATICIAIIFILGRLFLRPLFRSVARTRSPELFMAACLLVIVATGLAASIAGLSMALGALIAGLLLAETEYRRQIEVMVEPFKGLLLGVFLISAGMSIDLQRIAAAPLFIVSAVLGLVLIKTVIIASLVRIGGQSWSIGLRAGLLLGPGSEFSFVVIGSALALGLLDSSVSDSVLIVAALSMTLIPLLSKIGGWSHLRFSSAVRTSPELAEPLPADTQSRVLIAGFGRVGRVVASMLEAHQQPYIAIDADSERVLKARKSNANVYFGDAANIDFLRRCGLESARALVVTLDSAEIVADVVKAARQELPDLLIIARARDSLHAAQLYRAGATDAVPETIEASLQLSEAVLVDIGVPMGPVIASIHEKRAEFRGQVQNMAPDADVKILSRKRLRDVSPRQL